MGHYVLHHVWWYLAYFSVMVFALFYFVYWLSHFILNRYSRVLGFTTLANIASFPLFLLVIALFMFFTMPAFNAFSRHIEHEADRFGLEITHNNKAAAEGFIALQKENLVNPRPGLLHELWLGSHPSLAERIEFANSYCPWKINKSQYYEKYFKQKSVATIENIN